MSRVFAVMKPFRSRVSHNSPARHAPEVSVIHPRSVRSLLLALALLLTSASAVAAQVGRITGTVTDATTGAAVEGVQVFAEGTGYGAVSQANGRYFIINVPPGLYTLVARRVGYQPQRIEGVRVLIDVAREVNIRFSSTSATLAATRVEAERVPLIQPGITGSSDAITAEELQALPVSDIKGALMLQAGFLSVPDNTDVLTYTDVRRGLSPVYIRGGRASEVLTLIDGIPVNNFLFGGSAIDITTDAVQQIDYVRGGFEPQYGNALSGIVNMAIKEGTQDLRGSIESQTSGVGSALGSTYDQLRNYQQVQGFLSGSVPATQNRLRYMVAGRQRSGSARVLEFDDNVYNPRADIRDENQNFQSQYDLFPGFRAFGFDNQRDVIAKTSFYFTPLTKASFTFIDYQRQSQPFVFDWQQTGFDAFRQCSNIYPDIVETCRAIFNDGKEIRTLADLQDTDNENWYVRQSSVNQARQLYVGSASRTMGRMAITVAGGLFNQERNTCTYISGVCLGERISYTYINGPFVYTGGRSRNENQPLFGTEEIFGGDHIKTYVGRADLSWQATDHHNIQFGVFKQNHYIEFEEVRDVGLNRTTLTRSEFRSAPWDAAAYLQDRIEYDFLTLKIGARFDYGKAPGRFFADPRDPTNGTTAREVCLGTATSLGATTLYSFDTLSGGGLDTTYTGVAACSLSPTLLDSARRIALRDDFSEAPSRRQFSPRIGIQFPLSENSSLFFNFGRYAQNPSLYNLYRNTGIGVGGEGTPAAVSIIRQSGSRSLLGNPHLKTETTTSYEIGYALEFMRNYAFKITAFNKDQTGLTGFGSGGIRSDGSRVTDLAGTYGTANPDYDVLENRDFVMARGFETTLRRRLSNFWGFDLNYSFARVTQNADPPELEAEKRAEGDAPPVRPFRSSIDQPHVLNTILRFAADDRTPPIRYIGRFLRHSAVTTTFRYSSGLPYTPTFDFSGSDRSERNSGTSPTIMSVDMYGSKDWTFGNVRLGSFVRVSNLLDRRNCVQAFSSTGQCESGAFTAGTLEKGRIGAGIGSTNTFSQAFDRPDFRYPPRAISGGLRLTF